MTWDGATCSWNIAWSITTPTFLLEPLDDAYRNQGASGMVREHELGVVGLHRFDFAHGSAAQFINDVLVYNDTYFQYVLIFFGVTRVCGALRTAAGHTTSMQVSDI